MLPWRPIDTGVCHAIGVSLIGAGTDAPVVMQRVTAPKISKAATGLIAVIAPATAGDTVAHR